MPEAVFSPLLDFGALGIFACFLIWQHIRMQKRVDTLVDMFQTQLRECEDKQDARIEVIRSTYQDLLDRKSSDELDRQQNLDEVQDAIKKINTNVDFLMRIQLGAKKEGD